MKKSIFLKFLFAGAIAAALTVLPSFGQSPTHIPVPGASSTPAPTPVLQLPSNTQATLVKSMVATYVINQVNSITNNISGIVQRGASLRTFGSAQTGSPQLSIYATPAGKTPDVAPLDVQAALGTANLAKIQLVLQALQATDPAKIQAAATALSQ